MDRIGSFIGKLDKKYKQYRAEAPKREAEQLERIKSKTERAKVQARLKKERINTQKEGVNAKRELKEAQIALRKVGRTPGSKKSSFDWNSVNKAIFGNQKKTKKSVRRVKKKSSGFELW